MELQIKTDLNTFPKLIEFNYTELKQALSDMLQKYKGLVYSEDEIRNAKADRATLNKMKAAIDAERRSLKAICLQPFEDFDRKTRELIALVDEPVKEIDVQVKKFEQAKREERKQRLRKFYEDNAGKLLNFIPFSKIYKDAWANASASVKAVEETITNTIKTCTEDLARIEEHCKGEHYSACLKAFLNNLSLNDALAEKTRLEELHKKLQQVKAPEPKPIEAAVPNPIPVQPPVTEAPPMPQQGNTDEEIISLVFRVNATRAQLMALRQFLKDNDIHFERA